MIKNLLKSLSLRNFLILLIIATLNSQPKIIQNANGAASLRGLLSSAGQTTYDSTTDGNFFSVSASDYAAAFSGLSNVSKNGATDAEMNSACASSSNWSTNYAYVYSSTRSAVPANSWVVGFAVGVKTSGSPSISKLIKGAVFSGTYSIFGNSVSSGSNTGIQYFLGKNIQQITSADYIGHYMNAGSQCGVIGVGGQYSSGVGPWSSWSNYSAGPSPAFQAILATTNPWAVADSPTTIDISISSNTIVYRTNYTLTANLTGSNGKVTFYANGKKIPKCISVQSSGLVATCTYKPSVHQNIKLQGILTPPAGYTSSSSSFLSIRPISRSSAR